MKAVSLVGLLSGLNEVFYQTALQFQVVWISIKSGPLYLFFTLLHAAFLLSAIPSAEGEIIVFQRQVKVFFHRAYQFRLSDLGAADNLSPFNFSTFI